MKPQNVITTIWVIAILLTGCIPSNGQTQPPERFSISAIPDTACETQQIDIIGKGDWPNPVRIKIAKISDIEASGDSAFKTIGSAMPNSEGFQIKFTISKQIHSDDGIIEMTPGSTYIIKAEDGSRFTTTALTIKHCTE